MSTFAVAGVTGRVGSVVACDLLQRHHHVRGISRNRSRAAGWATGGGTVAIGSLDDASFLGRTLDGVDGFFALLPEDPFAADFHGGRRRMADAMATAIVRARVPHVVLLSAIAASLSDGNGPAKDLHYFERLLGSTDATVSILRACWFQENVAAAVDAASRMGIYPNLMGAADSPFPTVATSDVGHVAASLLVSTRRTSEVVDLIGPMYSPRDLATALGAALGKPAAVVDIPPPARVGTLVQAGLPPSFAETVAELYECFDAGRVLPAGDRTVTAHTTIEETLARIVRR
jgi:uncharacterized protein YbjT (DUF2867 family)